MRPRRFTPLPTLGKNTMIWESPLSYTGGHRCMNALLVAYDAHSSPRILSMYHFFLEVLLWRAPGAETPPPTLGGIPSLPLVSHIRRDFIPVTSPETFRLQLSSPRIGGGVSAPGAQIRKPPKSSDTLIENWGRSGAPGARTNKTFNPNLPKFA